jgi:hypothetical protein
MHEPAGQLGAIDLTSDRPRDRQVLYCILAELGALCSNHPLCY